ncbi:MAG: transcriptional repressor [Candidatus Marinimicrobia bacterium]|nr:transcriptional repressor [Candidatus Neomarinimicrobiota bacterium]
MSDQHALQQFIDFLQAEGKNITRERLDIFNEVLRQKSHFQIKDIIRKKNTSKHRISRATVYRTIKTIEEAGLIKYIRSINDEKIYEVVKGHHDHMICEACGKIIEFYDRDLEDLQNTICNSYHFTPVRHTMKIFGICENCRKKNKQ